MTDQNQQPKKAARKIQIRNCKKVDHLLGSLHMGDYVSAAIIIPPGGLSPVLTPEQVKAYDSPVFAAQVEAGELDVIVDGKSITGRDKPKAVKAPAKALVETVPAATAEAAELEALLSGNPQPE